MLVIDLLATIVNAEFLNACCNLPTCAKLACFTGRWADSEPAQEHISDRNFSAQMTVSREIGL